MGVRAVVGQGFGILRLQGASSKRGKANVSLKGVVVESKPRASYGVSICRVCSPLSRNLQLDTC
jgi:hypothetical protein